LIENIKMTSCDTEGNNLFEKVEKEYFRAISRFNINILLSRKYDRKNTYYNAYYFNAVKNAVVQTKNFEYLFEVDSKDLNCYNLIGKRVREYE